MSSRVRWTLATDRHLLYLTYFITSRWHNRDVVWLCSLNCTDFVWWKEQINFVMIIFLTLCVVSSTWSTITGMMKHCVYVNKTHFLHLRQFYVACLIINIISNYQSATKDIEKHLINITHLLSWHTHWESKPLQSALASRSLRVATSLFCIGFSGMRKCVRQYLYGKAVSAGGRG